MVPVAIAQRFELTIPVADWGAENNYQHPLQTGLGQQVQPALAGTAVPEAVWVVDTQGVHHPELPNVVAVVDPGISPGYVRLRAQNNAGAYQQLGIVAVSYKVRLYVQLGHTILGLMIQPPDPTPLGPTMWHYGGGGGGGAPPVAEETTPQITGNTQHFTTSVAYLAGSLRVWVNGLYQGVAGPHFTEDLNQLGFTFLDWVPQVGEEISILYWLP